MKSETLIKFKCSAVFVQRKLIMTDNNNGSGITDVNVRVPERGITELCSISIVYYISRIYYRIGLKYNVNKVFNRRQVPFCNHFKLNRLLIYPKLIL